MVHAIHPYELPSNAALSWCLAQLEPELGRATVLRVEPLLGGLDALTHRISLSTEQGELVVVMRRLHRSSSISRAAEELAALKALPELTWPRLPRLLAADAGAEHSERPTFLISHVPGAANLSAIDSSARLYQLAEALHVLHQQLPLVADGIPASERIADQADTALPDLPSLRLLRQAVAALPARTGTERLIHADYHIGNTLYEGNTLCGVVDWGTARVGPVEFDVAYCHMDLSLVFGEAAAATFLQRYETLRGAPLPDLPRWTLSAASQAYPDPARWLPSWHAWGRSDLTPALVRARFGQLVRTALERA